MSNLFQRTRDIASNPGTSVEATMGSRRSAAPVFAQIRERVCLAAGLAAMVSLAACGAQTGGGYGPSYTVNGNELVGGAIGAAGGGLLGSQFGRGSGKLAATGAGVLLGAILGSRVGGAVGYPQGQQAQQGFFQGNQQQPYYRGGQQQYGNDSMFRQGGYPPPPVGFVQGSGLSSDQMRLRQGLASAPVGSSLNYRDPQTGYVETYTIVREGQDGNGNFCRQFHADVISGGRPTSGYGTICQDRRDGSIHLSAADETPENRFAEITSAAPGYEGDAPAIRMG